MNSRTTRTRSSFWLAAVALLLAIGPMATFAGDDPELWVNGQDTNQLFVLNGNQLQATIPLPPGTGPHLTRFSPDGRFAYVAGVTSGDLVILDANTHAIVQILDLGASGVHEAQSSPDGAFVIVAQQATRELIRVDANPRMRVWTVADRLAMPAAPVCTIFIPGSDTAYVSLAGQDLAIVDLRAMQVTGVIDLNGQARCNYDWSSNGKTLYLTSENGTDGFLYSLDPATDAASLLRVFPGARDLHTPVVSASEKQVHIIGRGNDTFYTVDLAGGDVSSFEIGTPGVPDQPDGMVIVGNIAYVNLKATGKLAVIELNQGTISYVTLAGASPNAALNVVRRPG
jgi:DNA-binding beta-propeller fold protein YncE